MLRAQLRSSLMADAVAGGDPECVRILHRMGGKVDFKDAVRLHTPPHVLLLVSLALAHVCCMVQGGGENTSAASVVLRSRSSSLKTPGLAWPMSSQEVRSRARESQYES